MIDETSDDPREPNSDDDSMNTIVILDVRSADHDLDALADRIAALLAENETILIDLSHHADGGNRILLRTNRPSEETTT